MEKLKPCPFCGGKDLSIYIKGINDRKYAVCCNTCDARGGRKQGKGRAVEEWNRRADSGMRKTNVFYEQFREKAEFIKQEIESLEKEIKYAPAGILPELKERIKLLSILRHQYLECAEKYSEQKR